MARTKLPAAVKFFDAGCRFRRLKGEKGRRFSISAHMPPDDEHATWWWSKPKRVTLTAADDKTELLQEAESYRASLLGGDAIGIVGRAATVSEFVDYWRRLRNAKALSGDIQQETVEREQIELRLIESYLGSIPVCDLKATDIEDAYMRMSLAGVSDYERARTHAKLKTLLRHALRRGIVSNNAAEDVEAPPKTPKADKETLAERRVTLDEADLLMSQIRTEPRDGLRAAVWLAYTLGLRRGEALGLTWADIDTDTMTVHIRRQLSRRGTKQTKTYESERDLPLARPVWAYLEEWRNVQQATYASGLPVRDGRGRMLMTTNDDGERVPVLKAATWTPDVPVCTNRDGREWDVTNFNRSLRVFFAEHGLGEFHDRTTFEAQRIVRKDGEDDTKVTYECSRKSGYTGASLHSLRHSYCTSLIAAGVDVKSAQKLMGHSNIKTTLQIYADATDDGMREAAAMHAKRLITPSDEAEFDDELLRWMQENM